MNMQSKFAVPNQQWTRLATALSLSSGLCLAMGSLFTPVNAAPQASVVSKAVAFSCSDREATIKSKGGPSVVFGTAAIYTGYRQVSSTNKNPIMIRFDGGNRTWCKENYEVTGDDSTGYGLIWDGANVLYGVFSVTGTQGTVSQDFRRFATGGWLTSYGSGGGAKAAVVARMNPGSGNVTNATFLSAVLDTGRTNSLLVTGLRWTGSNLVVESNSWYAPRRADRKPMRCSGSSPFKYIVEFVSNLSSVVRVSADRCS